MLAIYAVPICHVAATPPCCFCCRHRWVLVHPKLCSCNSVLSIRALQCSQVGGKVAMDLTMPGVLAWVLGGNADKLRFEDRAPHCRLPDKPKTFDESVRTLGLPSQFDLD